MANLPAYMLIRQYVIEMVFTHRDCDRPVMSERELSRKFNVSRTTARMALEDLVRDGYLISRPRSGLYLAPGCQMPTSSVYPKILLLYGDGKYVYMGGFQLRMSAVLFSFLQTRPYRLCPVNLSAGCPPEEELSFYSASGILWIQAPAEMRDNLHRCREFCPVQELLSQTPGAGHSVRMDYREGGRLAVRWFRDRGIRSPWLLGCGSSFVRQEFQSGWMEELSRGGAEYDERFMIGLSSSRSTQLRERFRSARPKGIFCFGSEYAELAQSAPACPILCDDTPYAATPETAVPDAILEFAPESLIHLSMEELFARMRDKKESVPERLFLPHIRTAAENG